MPIPFTMPSVPELDNLQTEDRVFVMKQFSESQEAKNIIRKFKTMLIITLIPPIDLITLNLLNGWSLAISIAMLIVAIGYYRWAARRSILKIILQV